MVAVGQAVAAAAAACCDDDEGAVDFDPKERRTISSFVGWCPPYVRVSRSPDEKTDVPS